MDSAANNLATEAGRLGINSLSSTSVVKETIQRLRKLASDDDSSEPSWNNKVDNLITEKGVDVTTFPRIGIGKGGTLSLEEEEAFAGPPQLPDISLPVILTGFHTCPDSAEGISRMFRGIVDSCCALENQRKSANLQSSHFMTAALIQHVFTSTLPLPLPLSDPTRQKRCFWTKLAITLDVQQSILKSLGLIMRFYSAASLSMSQKTSPEVDSARIITAASITIVVDSMIRLIASDIPSTFSLHYR